MLNQVPRLANYPAPDTSVLANQDPQQLPDPGEPMRAEQ